MQSTSSEQKEKTPSITLFLGLIVLGAAGMAVWVFQLTQGMQVIGLEQQIVWGGYIAGFFTAAGAGAGLLSIASLNAIRPFVSMKMQLKLLVLSLACFAAAGVMITLDVGYPINLWHLVVAGKWTSLMTWDFWLLSITMLFSVLQVIFIKSRTCRFWFAVPSILSALTLVVVEAWMLSTMAARPLWGGGHLAASFLISAGIGGVGVAVWVLPVASTRSLRWWLKLFIGFSLVLILAQLIGGVVESLSFALPVWIHALAGLVLPFCLLNFQNPLGIRIAAVLAVFGVFMEKTVILSAGQAQPWLALPSGGYHISAIEALALVGAVAVGALIYLGIQHVFSNRRELDA